MQSLWASYSFFIKAGQAGDLKAGLGNPVLALQLEGKGVNFLLVGSIFIGLIVFTAAPRLPKVYRILLAIFVTISSIVVLFLSGMYIETASIVHW
ncbi:MAG: hypothetical protein GX640_23370 [Fibrobacter sp.]|nr:hypothetical protein [Fibrobacter sp.]